ncbi:hypothetical protein HDE_03602 [Halotydeus destructor]|nr:hypothetical protein HDE_03602 [Halotydeus destructor]
MASFTSCVLMVVAAIVVMSAIVVDQVSASRRFEKGVLLGYLLAQQQGHGGQWNGNYGGYGGSLGGAGFGGF